MFWTGLKFPRWLGFVIHSVAMPLVHAGIPWTLSRFTKRHGWIEESPGTWNLAGLVLVAAGCLGLIWGLREHFVAAPDGWTVEATPHYPTPAYLLRGGPYRYSRHPLYIAEGLIWIGWTIFYGSLVLVGVLCTMALILGPVILPREERGLEARFGEVYREYRRTVPFLLGRRRRPDARG